MVGIARTTSTHVLRDSLLYTEWYRSYDHLYGVQTSRSSAQLECRQHLAMHSTEQYECN
jgi:hypothetical protein